MIRNFVLISSMLLVAAFIVAASVMLATGRRGAVIATFVITMFWLLTSYAYSAYMVFIKYKFDPTETQHEARMYSLVSRRFYAMETWVIFIALVLMVFGGYTVLYPGHSRIRAAASF